jgi:signal transduction histidine kinase
MYAITFTLLAIISFSIFYYRIYSVAMERVDDELLDDTEVYATLLEARGLEAFKDRLAEEAEAEDPDEEFYHLIDFKGKTLFASDVTAWDFMEIKGTRTSLQDDQISPVFKTIPAPDGDHKARTISAVIGPDTILQIGETLEETDEYMEVFSDLFLILVVILIILSTLIGWYLARLALVDMEEVTQTAEEISNGSYHRRVDVTGQLTEIKKLSSTFNTMLDRIQSLLNSMKEINDNIAHDLRSPLARIRGIAEMTLVGNKAVDEYKDMAVSTMEECDSLIEMINTMLDITEAEAGVNGAMEEEFDLTAMIINACELFRPIADQKGIEIICNLPQALIFRGARKKMQRVVTNLLENAIKYTPEHGTVAVSVAARGGEIQIDFKDTGIGISEEELPHIFERFYRCDRSRTQGGVGLGLSLAKAFAVSMKGMIQVNSVINQGSTFTLKFAQ